MPWADEADIISVPTPPERPRSRSVAWLGEFSETHSLSLVNREICRRLIERGSSVCLVYPSTSEDRAGSKLPTALQRHVRQSLPPAADVVVTHLWPPHLERPTARRWVIMQPWEFGSLPKNWIGPLSGAADEVWVYSRCVRECFIESGVPGDKIHVIPLGVSPKLFGDRRDPYPLKTRKQFKFLFIGGTIFRKGVDVLLAAFAQAFSRRADVCLVIKDLGSASFYRGQTAEDAIKEFRRDCDAPEIEYIDAELDETDMARLYASCDCCVHPYRGEGFGLPIVEAMANALPAIVTGAGPSLDYCTDDNAFLIPASKVHFREKAVGGLETVDYPWLFEPDGDFLRYQLRRVVEEPAAAAARGRAAAVTVRTAFTWERSAGAVEYRLHQLTPPPSGRVPVGTAPGGTPC